MQSLAGLKLPSSVEGIYHKGTSGMQVPFLYVQKLKISTQKPLNMHIQLLFDAVRESYFSSKENFVTACLEPPVLAIKLSNGLPKSLFVVKQARKSRAN